MNLSRNVIFYEGAKGFLNHIIFRVPKKSLFRLPGATLLWAQSYRRDEPLRVAFTSDLPRQVSRLYQSMLSADVPDSLLAEYNCEKAGGISEIKEGVGD